MGPAGRDEERIAREDPACLALGNSSEFVLGKPALQRCDGVDEAHGGNHSTPSPGDDHPCLKTTFRVPNRILESRYHLGIHGESACGQWLSIPVLYSASPSRLDGLLTLSSGEFLVRRFDIRLSGERNVPCGTDTRHDDDLLRVEDGVLTDSLGGKKEKRRKIALCDSSPSFCVTTGLES